MTTPRTEKTKTDGRNRDDRKRDDRRPRKGAPRRDGPKPAPRAPRIVDIANIVDRGVRGEAAWTITKKARFDIDARKNLSVVFLLEETGAEPKEFPTLGEARAEVGRVIHHEPPAAKAAPAPAKSKK